ncbi:MAG: hypothetical protein J6K31_03795 [Parabacteroides sp.]|nr:hypothetical protein [Parabacteroides sp.]
MPVLHGPKWGFCREVRSFLPRSPTSSLGSIGNGNDEVRLQGDEDGRRGDEVPPHGGKEAISL